MKYTLKEKLKYVKMHVNDNAPLRKIHNKYGMGLNELKYLCNLYKLYGEEQFNKEIATRTSYTSNYEFIIFILLKLDFMLPNMAIYNTIILEVILLCSNMMNQMNWN